MRIRLNAPWTLATLALLLLAAVAPAANEAATDEPSTDEPASVTAAAAPPIGGATHTDEDAAAGGAGLRVYLDPETGQLRSRPADEEGIEFVGRPGDRLNTYSRDLLQERIPQGGFKVDLRGRFRSSVVATIDPVTDEVEIDCISTTESGEVSHDD